MTTTPLPSGRVTLLFSDIQGSTAMLTRLGDAYGDVLDVHDRIMREAFATYGGYEFSNEGDAFGAAFGDPALAVRAVLEIQERIESHEWPAGERVRVRMGLHHGEPKVRGNDYWGEDVHFAARICSAAHGGQVLMSAAMRAAVADDPALSLGHHGLKDFPTPRELFQLVLPGRPAEEFPAPKTLTRFRSNLPSITTPLIGRDDVLADLVALYEGGQRLVTLTGAGGMGKTRTAVAVGELLVDEFADGIAFVPLAAVDERGVTAAIADATGAPRGGDLQVAVLEHLERRRMLVILDNCEHLVEAAADMTATLLDRCGQLAVLATAQLPLDLTAETVYRLPPLTTGVEMFLERARARDRSFAASDRDLQVIQQICALLEGFPLAIELAAARVRLLGVDRLLAALQRDLGALGSGGRDLPERHRTLGAALDWTLSLLTPAEKDVFTALGAFAMAWTLEQAEKLLAADQDELSLWEALTRLMDASLVVVRGDGRFAMPQRVRQHAAELLAAAPEADRRRRAHAELVSDEMRELASAMFVDYRRQLANLVDLLPEARQAIAWAREQDLSTHRRVVGLVAPALAKTGDLAIVAADLEGFPEPQTVPTCYDDATHSYALGLLHAMRWSTDTDGEVGCFTAAARGFLSYGEVREAAEAKFMAASAWEVGGQLEPARREMQEIITELGPRLEPLWVAEVERLATGFYHDVEDLVAARTAVEARLGTGSGLYSVYGSSIDAWIAWKRGAPRAGLVPAAQALSASPRQQLYLILNSVKAIAWLLAEIGRDAEAVELREAVRRLYRTRTGADHGEWTEEITATFEAAARRLGDEMPAVLERSAALSYDDVVDRALELALRHGSALVEERS